MGVIVKDSGGGSYDIPLGVHSAVCANVYDVGMQPGYNAGTMAHKVVVLWEIEERKEEDNARYTITKEYTASLNEKANLRKDLEAWRGRPFTIAELEGFDLDNIVGAPCQLSIIEYQKQNGNTGTKISAVMPIGKGMVALKAETPRDFIPDWIRKKRGEEVAEDAHDDSPPPFDDDIPF